MHSMLMCGRLLSRTLVNGIYNVNVSNTSAHSEASPNRNRTESKRKDPQLLTAVSGFPKNQAVERMKKWQFGDDACFIAKYKTADVLGVADGVGGWRHYGIDPGHFSASLMQTCERLVLSGGFSCSEPSVVLARSYYELQECKQPVVGSSTACVVILDRREGRLYAANIGDSGFLVVRGGRVVHRSLEQQHYFNTPFQLSLPPPDQDGVVLSDSPDAANTSDFPVEDGDVIMLGTDGIFDNLPDALIVAELHGLEGVRDVVRLQQAANSLALQARTLSFDADYLSPFSINARKNGINARGGKPDDITVILATVVT